MHGRSLRRRQARSVFVTVSLILSACAGLPPVAAEESTIPAAPDRNDPPRVFVSGVRDDFTATRAAIAAAKQATGRDYRVVVVDTATSADSAAELLEQVVARWRTESQDGGFNPAGDVTIVLDVGDRQIAMDVPWAMEASSGLDRATLEAELIATSFVPRAKDGLFDQGLAELIAATEQWIKDKADDRQRQAEATRVFKTRTLPLGLLGLGTAGLLGGLLVQWSRHGRRVRVAREKLAAFKSEVVSLSDLLDGQQERHRMLPHSDPDFMTPMQGMTRSTYDNVQGSIGRYRERWLGLMDVWERAQEKIESEWFLGTSAADDAVKLLDSAEARPPLADVAAECRAPLDALEQAHERAREAAATLDTEITEAAGRLEGVPRRGRSDAVFQATLAEVARGRTRFGEQVEGDPVAARGGLDEARAALEALRVRLDAFEAADDRRQKAASHTEELRKTVRGRRAEGWLLAEPGANPDDRLDAAVKHVELAAQLLDAGETEAALTHVERAEQANAEAAALVESLIAARARAEELLPACVARVEALVVRRQAAIAAVERLANDYAESGFSDVADNVARADDGLYRVRTLIDEAREAMVPQRQHHLRAVAVLEETVRQEDWVEGCLAAIIDRLAELDELQGALPGRRDTAVRRVATLEQRLRAQRTDRVRANERCREAVRIIEVVDEGLRASRPDPRQTSQLVQAADTAVARGEELADEDDRLARQAANDIDETDALVRRVAAWYAEGVQADARGAASAVETARSLLERQRYEEAIHTAAEASQQARIAYATATAEAERRRVRRQQEIQRRQMEESFARMSRGAGPWVVRLPGGTFSGPDPWRSMASQPRRSPPAGGNWSRDIAQVDW
ncbi:MAG: TPM domain-containing protein [Pirellulales bacterium]